jgi:hypothetical protein
MNNHKVLSRLGEHLYTHKPATKGADGIFRAFSFARVADIEATIEFRFVYLLCFTSLVSVVAHRAAAELSGRRGLCLS